MRYVLPAVVDPPTSVCYKINVPNDPMHIAAFKGAIFNLAWSQNWARDDANTAAEVSRVWQAVFDDLEVCMDLQFRTVASCLLEASYDGGVTWVPIFDASACANEVIEERIDDGTLAPGGQQPPQEPVPGQCYTYHVKLDGNSRWISPVPVETGDVITVTDAKGAWYNGAAYPLGPWNCPDGLIYAGGICGGAPTIIGTNPAPTLGAMRLIGNIPGETPDEFFDMYNQSHSVTVSSPAPFYLMPNDESLEDNQGSITFTVEICKSLWCYNFDFSVDNGAWASSAVDGTGWGASYTGGRWQAPSTALAIKRSIPAETTIRTVRAGTDAGIVTWNVRISSNDNATPLFSITSNPGEVKAVNWHIPTGYNLFAQKSGTGHYITSVTLTGIEDNPFGLDNC